MISINQLVKIGRQKIILEVSDKLQINDFFNETGYQHSTMHGRYSRFKLTIVDTKQGKKDNSSVLNYNFTVDEFRKLSKILGVTDTHSYVESICNKLTPELYQKNSNYFNKKNGKDSDYLSSLKINHHRKDGQGKSPVLKIALTYESAMRSESKWKIYIEEGTGIAQKDGNFFKLKSGTYSKIKSSFINLTRDELIQLVTIPLHYLNRWEQNHQLEFEKNRSNFLKRFKDSNYDESSISEWNMNPKEKEKNRNQFNQSNQSNTKTEQPKQPQKQDIGGNICSHCGNTVNENVAKYSQRTFKKVLCRECQEEYRNQSNQANTKTEQPKQPQKQDIGGNICSHCGNTVNENVAKYSQRTFKKVLCRECQEEYRTQSNTQHSDENVCCDCRRSIKNKNVVDYSIKVYGKTLCMDCQKKNRKIS